MLKTLIKLEQQKEEYVKIQKETDLFISENYQPESKFAIDLVNRNIKKNYEAIAQIKSEFRKAVEIAKADIVKYHSENKDFAVTPERLAKGDRALDIIARSGGKLSPESIKLLLADVVDPVQMQIISDLLPSTECNERLNQLRTHIEEYSDVLKRLDDIVVLFDNLADKTGEMGSYTVTQNIYYLQDKVSEFKLKYDVSIGKRAPQMVYEDATTTYEEHKKQQEQETSETTQEGTTEGQSND